MTPPIDEKTDAKRWRKNTGARPSDLKDDDKVFVRLANGREPIDSWTVRTNGQHAIRWSLTNFAFDISEWRRA